MVAAGLLEDMDQPLRDFAEACFCEPQAAQQR
jgi:hypothetical protein